MEDWELSAEELDSLERDALQQLALRHSTNSTAQASASSLPAIGAVPYSRSSAMPPASCSTSNDRMSASHQASKSPLSVTRKVIDNSSNQPNQKLTVKFFLHSSGNVAAKFQFHQTIVGAFRNIPRASWNANERLWVFPLSSLSTAEQVLHDISPMIELENLDTLVRRAIAAATGIPDLRGKFDNSPSHIRLQISWGHQFTGYVTQTFDVLLSMLLPDRYDKIPGDIEAKLLPFQRDGVRFVLQHGGRVLLADEMGLGKTLQAIAFTSCIREAWPVLVLTPSSLRLQWASMIQQWLNVASSDILVVLSQCSGSNRGGYKIVQSNSRVSVNLDGVFNIISYDTVPKLQDILLASKFQVVIADESHFLKNAQAKRTCASLPILQRAQYTILLSGTPALSRPIELFKQLEALYPDVYKNVHEYGDRYCKGGVFGIYQGASNHEELHNLMKATVMIRRLKKDVLAELPVKRRQQVFLDLEEKEMRQINALFSELKVIKSQVKSSQRKEEAELLKLKEKNLINMIYTESAEAKIPAVLDYIGTIIEASCKFLIFAHHQPMINSIHKFLLKKKVGCIKIDGSTPASSRQVLVTEFQEKDTVRAAVLSIKAGGVGLTLTAASMVIFAELSWTPGDVIQAEDRAHRIGQVSSVNIYYLLANDTVDDIIWDVIQSKLENLGQMLDGHENSLEVSVKQPRSDSPPLKQRKLDAFMKSCCNK